MKIAELKSILEKLDDNAEVYVRNNDTYANLQITKLVTDEKSIVILPVLIKG